MQNVKNRTQLKTRYAGLINTIEGLEKSRVAFINELKTVRRTKERAQRELASIRALKAEREQGGVIALHDSKDGLERRRARQNERRVNNLSAKEKYYSRIFWDAKDTELNLEIRIKAFTRQIEDMYSSKP